MTALVFVAFAALLALVACFALRLPLPATVIPPIIDWSPNGTCGGVHGDASTRRAVRGWVCCRVGEVAVDRVGAAP